MAAPRPWTDTDDTTLRQLHAAGKSLHAIAGDLGRSKAVVSRYAKQAGLSWDRAVLVSQRRIDGSSSRARWRPAGSGCDYTRCPRRRTRQGGQS